MPTLAINPRAKFDFEILETIEGGLKLSGAEVKSARAGHVSLKGSFLSVQNGELFLKNTHIGKYAPAGRLQDNYDTRRDRKVLVHGRQLKNLTGKKETQGLTLVPIRVYTKGNLIKVEFAVARGKKKFDKREVIKKRDLDRQARTEMKTVRYG